jgi:hypothetical protein
MSATRGSWRDDIKGDDEGDSHCRLSLLGRLGFLDRLSCKTDQAEYLVR